MRRVRILLSVVLGVSSLGVVSSSPVSALPPLPAGAGDLTADINWSQFLTPIMNAGAISCTVNSVAGTTLVTQGTTLNPMTNLMVDGLKLQQIINDSDADVGATCTSEVDVPTSEITVTGVISAPSMPANIGTSGNLTLKCRASSATPKISVSVAAKFGGAVGKARITGQSSTGTVNFACSMGLTFNPNTGLVGTVNGELNVANASANTSCANQNTPTCIPVGISNASVTVVSGGGELAEAAGTGTYSFNDSFKLAAIDSALVSLGVSSIRKQALRPMLAANTDEMKLSLAPGTHTARVNAATGSSVVLKTGTKLRVTSSPFSTCKATVKFKRTTVTLGSPKVSAMGDVTYTVSSSAVRKLKAAGVKKNTKLQIVTACKSGTKTATARTSSKFAG
jgi:hypothetical protein